MAHIPSASAYADLLAGLPEDKAVYIVSELSSPTDVIRSQLFFDRAEAKAWAAQQPDPLNFTVAPFTTMHKNGSVYLRPGEPDMRRPTALRAQGFARDDA